MINNVTLVGRLGHDVELRFLPTGKPVTRLRIATDASYKDSDGDGKGDDAGTFENDDDAPF